MKHLLCLTGFAVFVIAYVAVGAAEQPAAPAKPEAKRPAVKFDRTALIAKLKNGQQLTEEERKFLRGHAARRPRTYVRQYGGAQLNPIDRARFDIARLLVRGEKPAEAIEELQRVIEKSPDENAKSQAHITMGDIYRRNLKQPEKAIAEYQQVKGTLLSRAAMAIAEMYAEMGQPDKASESLNKLIDATDDPGQKVQLLRQVSQIYQNAGENDKAIEALRKITETITYEDAEKMKETTATRDRGGDARKRIAEMRKKAEAARQKTMRNERKKAGAPGEMEIKKK